jgi:DNA excision repair protein ERCC-5
MEGKALAIDSSIWIYQFQATMRDKEGRGLNNAHVLGFLRRICKLLFYGIKPVFVFDGGVPAIKRSTIVRFPNSLIATLVLTLRLCFRRLNVSGERPALPKFMPKWQKSYWQPN